MKFGLLFAHQVPPESGIASSETYRDMLDCLPRAEELGYVSAFQCSHHIQKDGFCPSPLSAMAGAAAVTERMRIGTAVLLVPLYAPLKLAEDIAVIDNLSGGRFVFGVAPGYVSQEFTAHGVPREERVGRFEEALDLMIQAWSGEPFSFEGRYYRVPEGRVTPKPVQSPHPPIWYGVSAPGSLRRAAARRSVQIMSPRHGLAELQDHFRPYEAAAEAAGWEIPERPIIRQVFVAPTIAEAEAKAAPAVDYLYRELYGAASAAGDRVLRRDDGSVIEDSAEVAFATLQGPLHHRRPGLRDPPHPRLPGGGEPHRDDLLDAHARHPRHRRHGLARTLRQRGYAAFPVTPWSPKLTDEAITWFCAGASHGVGSDDRFALRKHRPWNTPFATPKHTFPGSFGLSRTVSAWSSPSTASRSSNSCGAGSVLESTSTSWTPTASGSGSRTPPPRKPRR